jgi:hypothetical protein
VNINNETKSEHLIKLCLNRFKTCRIDPTSHTYVLDTEIEDGKHIMQMG